MLQTSKAPRPPMLLGNMRHLGVHNLVALIDVSKTRRTIGWCGGNAIQQQKRIFIGWGFVFCRRSPSSKLFNIAQLR
jgi:predicted enzyme related to lactoylglutathione lyase